MLGYKTRRPKTSAPAFLFEMLTSYKDPCMGRGAERMKGRGSKGKS
jgi:hypothetical protein